MEGILKIKDCTKLKALIFENGQYSDCKALEITNVKNLKTINFGSYCFEMSDCILKGIFD